jgi:hypothetical protein
VVEAAALADEPRRPRRGRRGRAPGVPLRRASIPLGDAPALRRARNRTRLIRTVLATALVAAAVAAVVTARAPAASSPPFVSSGSNGIIVLDLSASVEKSTLADTYRSLMRLAASKGHYGLVLVSDDAYEALPPETPAAALSQVARFFTPIPPAREGAGVPTVNPSGGVSLNQVQPVYPANPWGGGFSFGTKLSAGLDLARSIILAHRTTVKPSVWLVSDLGDEPSDLQLVAADGKEYVQDGIALNVVGLDPTRSDARFFDRIVGYQGALPAVSPPPPPARARQRFPLGLAIAAVVLAVLLAANELWSSPLRWRPASSPEGPAAA